VTVAGGTPTLTLNDGGTATYTGGSGTNALTFSYTAAAGQNTPDLTVTAVNLNGGTIKDGAGNNASLSGTFSPAGTLQIDTMAPAPPTVTEQITGGNQAVLSGTAQTGVVISVYDGTALLGTTSVNTEGDWTFTTSALAQGAHTFTATAADAAGNVSAFSSPNPAVVVGQSDTSPSPSSQTVGQILAFPSLLNLGAKDGIGQPMGGSSTPTVLAYLQNNIQSGGTLPIADASRCALLGNYVASSLVVPNQGLGAIPPNDLPLGSAPVLASPHHT
jgi:Bacterial Ig-like domain